MRHRIPLHRSPRPSSLVAAAALALVACGHVETRSGFDNTGPGGDAGPGVVIGGETDSGAGSIVLGDAGTSGGACGGDGWSCKIAVCDGGARTTVTAKVYDPAGMVPLYDVAVYVPNANLDPITTGPTCDNCATPTSGEPVVSTLTDATGTFVLTDAPVGTNVPLVIQIGKWRRQIALSQVLPCQDNPFDDPTLFRLPRTQSEGNLPKIALATGGADTLECLLRRMGIADSEFTNPTARGGSTSSCRT